MQTILIKLILGLLQSTLIPLTTKFLEKKLKQMDIDKL
jgi:hypothetical protein